MNSRFLAVLLWASLAVAIPLNAQISWAPLSQPFGGSVFTFVDVGQKIVAGSESNRMLSSTDDGQSWQPYGGAALGFFPLFVNSSNHLFAVTDDDGGLFRTTNDGVTWEQRAEGLEGSMRLAGIADNDDLFALTTEGVWRSTNAGGSWTKVFTPEEGSLDWMTVAPDGTVFVREETENLPLWRSTDAGATWQVIREGVAVAGFVFEEDGEFYMATQDGIWHTTDNGDSFSLFAFEGNGPISAFAFKRDATGWFWILTPMEGAFRISPDGTEIYVLSSPAGSAFTLFVTNQNSPLIGYQDIGIWRSGNGEESWQQVGVVGAGEIVGLAEGNSGTLFANVSGHLFSSADAGSTFQVAPIPSWDAQMLLANTNGTVVATTRQGMFYLSSDGGSSWEGMTLGGAESITQGIFTSVGTLLLASNNGILRTTDQGGGWEINDAFQSVDDFARSPNGDLWCLGSWRLFRSTDDGQTWEQRSDLELPVTQVEVTADGTILITGASSYLLRSTDQGITWENIEMSCGDTEERRLWASPTGKPYIGTDCGLYSSVDNGLTWAKAADSPDDKTIISILFATSGHVYAGTASGLYRSSNVSSVPRQNTPLNNPELALQAWHHPISENLTATFRLGKPGGATLRLFDMAGNEASSLERAALPNGPQQIYWHLGDAVVAGTYLLQLTSDEGVATTKVHVVR